MLFKRLLLTALAALSFGFCHAQNGQLSYEDLKFLVHNNLPIADTFLMVKGYKIVKKNDVKKTRNYSITPPNGIYENTSIRQDGKKIYIEVESNSIEQYNLIHDSIVQFLDKSSSTAGIQVFATKDLGSIYIMLDDATTVDPLKKEYTIQVVASKNITSYNN